MHRLNSPVVNLLIVALVYAVFLVLLLTKINYHSSYLISLGEKFITDFNLVPQNVTIWANDGYDGQFYYRLALNPFTSKQEEFGIKMDIPSYRQQRIIYPLLTWALSLGNRDFVPTLLLVVNFIALLLIGLLGGYFAKSLNLHSLWGLVFAIHPGFPYTLSRDLVEILQAGFLLATLFVITTHRYLIAAILLTLAILTKESALVVAISLVLTFKSRYFLIPIFTYLIWQLGLFLNWGQAPIFLGYLSLGYPFLGLNSFLNSTLALATRDQRLGFIQLCFLLIFIISVFHAFVSSKDLVFKKLAWVLYLLMGLSYTAYIWVADIAFFRALTEFYIIGAAILISSKSKIRYLVFLLTTVIWLLSINQIV